MNLAAGTRLGPYEIVSPLGAGGMGEVYRARDTRLGREVAVKVLPQHLSSNAEVRSRFEREAKTVSGLNHPHICVLHDVGRDGDTDYLVMELVDGETLAARVAKGPLPLADVLRIGAEIADALDRAHRAGVVHRDLKPGNIMLTRSGSKLMDFGLARASGLAGAPGSGVTVAALTQSPTVAQPLTAEGTIVGTFQYMAPEQLEGGEADSRSDVWALGCVLYEMATGRRAFDGKSQASLITSIMGSEPAPISQAVPMAPPALWRIVQACLAKDPADRIQSAHDVKLQLQWIAEGGSDAGLPKVVAKQRRNRERVAWIAVVVLAIVAGALARGALSRKSPPADVLRTVIGAPPGSRLQITGDDAGPPALSPDGSALVFAAVGGGGGKRLWIRRLDDLTARPLGGTDGAAYPFWSPDGASIAFFASGQLKRLDLAQGSVITLASGLDSPRGGAWSSDGVIVFPRSYGSSLSRVSESGGPLSALTTLDSTMESTHRFPQFMPDGKHFIYLAARHTDEDGDSSAICFASLDGGKPARLFASRSSAIYTNGFLLFVRDSTLMAQEFDPASGAVRGEPRPTREVVQLDGSTWNAPVSASANGMLVYGLGGRAGNTRIVRYDRTGEGKRNLTGFGNLLSVDMAPDGRRIVFEWQQRPLADLWTLDMVTGTRTRVTTNPDDENSGFWSADGKKLIYSARRDAGRFRIMTMRSDGSGAEQTMLDLPGKDCWPFDVHPDGRTLLYGAGISAGTQIGGLCLGTPGDGGEPNFILPESASVLSARFSADGKWIAFDADLSGRPEIYVAPVPPPGEGLAARWQVSSQGGRIPRWRQDDRELYYVRTDGMIMAVSVDASGHDFRVLGEQALFRAFQRTDSQTFDAAPDGQAFVINTLGGNADELLAVVSNWMQTVKVK